MGGQVMMLNQIYKKPLEHAPDKAAIILKDQSLTYRQLDEATRRYAATLSDLGVG